MKIRKIKTLNEAVEETSYNVVVNPVYANALEQHKVKREKFEKDMKERNFQMPNEDRFAHAKVDATKEMKKMSLAESFFTEWVNEDVESLDWVLEKDEDFWHANANDFYFNIYNLGDNEYNLVVDYKDKELDYLDGIFTTVEEAKSKAEEILKNGLKEIDIEDLDDEEVDEFLNEDVEIKETPSIEECFEICKKYYFNKDAEEILTSIYNELDVIDSKVCEQLFTQLADKISGVGEDLEDSQRYPVEKPEAKDSTFVSSGDKQPQSSVKAEDSTFVSAEDKIVECVHLNEGSYQKGEGNVYFAKQKRGPIADVIQATLGGGEWGYVKSPDGTITPSLLPHLSLDESREIGITWTPDDKCHIEVTLRPDSIVTKEQVIDVANRFHKPYMVKNGANGKTKIFIEVDEDNDFEGNYVGDDFEINYEGIKGRGTNRRGNPNSPMVKAPTTAATEPVEENLLMEEEEKMPMEEDVQINVKGVEYFVPTGMAVETLNKIEDAGKVNTLNFMLEDMYPQGITAEELNKLLSDSADWVLDMVGVGKEEKSSTDDDFYA